MAVIMPVDYKYYALCEVNSMERPHGRIDWGDVAETNYRIY